MSRLKDYIYKSIESKILSWDKNVVDQVYVISLYISNSYDDPRRPMITLGYNTINQFKSSVREASDIEEAKWNYAFWLQNEELIIGDNYDENIEDGRKITEWIKENNLYYSDEDEEQAFDRTIILGKKITHNFVELCIEVVKQLHDEGIVKDKFGRSIPVLIHELEYYDTIAEQNEIANPKEVVKEFVDWIWGMYK